MLFISFHFRNIQRLKINIPLLFHNCIDSPNPKILGFSSLMVKCTPVAVYQGPYVSRVPFASARVHAAGAIWKKKFSQPLSGKHDKYQIDTVVRVARATDIVSLSHLHVRTRTRNVITLKYR